MALRDLVPRLPRGMSQISGGRDKTSIVLCSDRDLAISLSQASGDDGGAAGEMQDRRRASGASRGLWLVLSPTLISARREPAYIGPPFHGASSLATRALAASTTPDPDSRLPTSRWQR